MIRSHPRLRSPLLCTPEVRYTYGRLGNVLRRCKHYGSNSRPTNQQYRIVVAAMEYKPHPDEKKQNRSPPALGYLKLLKKAVEHRDYKAAFRVYKQFPSIFVIIFSHSG